MARLQQYSNISETSMQSDNSTDSSDGSVVGGHVEGVNVEVEKMLPSVVSRHANINHKQPHPPRL